MVRHLAEPVLHMQGDMCLFILILTRLKKVSVWCRMSVRQSKM